MAPLTLEPVYPRVAPLVFRRCRAILGSDADAEDAAQEVLMKIQRHLPRLESPAALTSWVYRTATNHCLNELRRRRRDRVELTRDGEVSGGAGPDPRRALERTATLQHVLRRLIERFGERKVQPVHRYYDEMTPPEIGRVLGISERAVRKALTKLESRLGEELAALRAELQWEGANGS